MSDLLEEIREVNIPEDLANLFSLNGYTSVVTGGASGLGEAIALGLAVFGSNVILLDINYENLERVRKRVENIGRQCTAMTLDVTSWESVSRAADMVRDLCGAPDVLVNSAGMNIRKPALELSPKAFIKVVNVDLTGTFLCCKAFGALMAARGQGSVINLSSINAHVALEKNSAYGAAKGGVVQLTRVLALEWARYNVRVNALSPAHHKTPLVEQMAKDPDWYANLIRMIPQGRFAQAHEIIGPTIFLASRASSFTTGTSMLTDGGWTMV